MKKYIVLAKFDPTTEHRKTIRKNWKWNAFLLDGIWFLWKDAFELFLLWVIIQVLLLFMLPLNYAVLIPAFILTDVVFRFILGYWGYKIFIWYWCKRGYQISHSYCE